MSTKVNRGFGEPERYAKFAKSEPEAIVMWITPELAGEMLKTSRGNRKIRDWYVNEIAASMRRGAWRVTSQGVGFDVHGRLLDAHHRLNGSIIADTSFLTVVVFGLRADAYEVIDTGIKRTYADLLLENAGVAEILRLGCQYALGTSRPTVDQMKPIISCGLRAAADALIQFCGTRRKFYSSAAMKLAACITIMNGGDADYVLGQYRALCTLDFEQMTEASQSLVRQVDNKKAIATNTRESLARGLRVFDKKKRGITKVKINEDDIEAAVGLVRSTLRTPNS